MCEEMKKLINLLKDDNIPFKTNLQPMFNNALQIIIMDKKGKRIGDVISHYASYGGNKGLLETYYEGDDTVEGYLTANEAYDIITNFWFK